MRAGRAVAAAGVCAAGAGIAALAWRRGRLLGGLRGGLFDGARGGLRAVEVTGESMLPALRAGDWLLVRAGAPVRDGDAVVARHPWNEDRLIVKRAVREESGGWWLESDNQRAHGRQDSWDFDAVPHDLVLGPVVARYWPFRRAGLLSRSARPR
ncbi:S24 family peptidase [Actinomadura harenae]|uniref:S24 family peptidase n=2 Tax=Actinomadura harenae TaxID=2483351 RepID=A0A3M2LN29_9ACTN|nr:S24 family peptidase [Actinomadura harenae]